MSPRPAQPLWLVSFIMLCDMACIQPPALVLVDRATALEQQAAGSYPEIERKLVQEGITARPVPLTPDVLQSLGIRPAPLADEIDLSDADRVDQLLAQRCVGEALDGTLVDTFDSCREAADRALTRVLIERANRARQQLWRYLQARKPKAALAEVRGEWRAAHLRTVVCGGWIQRGAEAWEAKACDKP